MSDTPATQPPGWYYAQGDPPGTQRYWDGTQWQGAPQPVPGAGQVAGAESMNLADGGTRILARLIDMVIFFVVSLVTAAVIGGGGAFGSGFGWSLRGAIAGLVGGLIVIAYEVYFVANGGATLGKKALSLQVINEDGSDPDYEVAVRRFAPYIASTVAGLVPVLGAIVGLAVFVIGIVSLVMIFTDDKHQALWDRFASTLVIKK